MISFKRVDENPKLKDIINKYKNDPSIYTVVFDYDLIAPSEVYQMIFFNPEPKIINRNGRTNDLC